MAKYMDVTSQVSKEHAEVFGALLKMADGLAESCSMPAGWLGTGCARQGDQIGHCRLHCKECSADLGDGPVDRQTAEGLLHAHIKTHTKAQRVQLKLDFPTVPKTEDNDVQKAALRRRPPRSSEDQPSPGRKNQKVEVLEGEVADAEMEEEAAEMEEEDAEMEEQEFMTEQEMEEEAAEMDAVEEAATTQGTSEPAGKPPNPSGLAQYFAF
jgi:hypothetical protein